jgi:hypothetical protein
LWWQFWTCQWWKCLRLHSSDKLPAIMSISLVYSVTRQDLQILQISQLRMK